MGCVFLRGWLTDLTGSRHTQHHLCLNRDIPWNGKTLVLSHRRTKSCGMQVHLSFVRLFYHEHMFWKYIGGLVSATVDRRWKDGAMVLRRDCLPSRCQHHLHRFCVRSVHSGPSSLGHWDSSQILGSFHTATIFILSRMQAKQSSSDYLRFSLILSSFLRILGSGAPALPCEDGIESQNEHSNQNRISLPLVARYL